MKTLATSISSKFSLYDQVGYLLVGSVLLLLVALDLMVLGRNDLIPEFALQNALVWIIIAYLVGHIVQAVANIVVREDKDNYSEADRKVLDHVKDYFAHTEWTDREAFQHCYIWSCGRDIAGQVTAFSAYYSLYRGWFVLFFAETLFLLFGLLKYGFSWTALLIVLGSGGITVLMYYRRKIYWDYVTTKTLQTFVVVRRLEE